MDVEQHRKLKLRQFLKLSTSPPRSCWSGPPRRSSERSVAEKRPWRGTAAPSKRGGGYTKWALNSPNCLGAVWTRLSAEVSGYGIDALRQKLGEFSLISTG
jgi:hypothetical protein